MVQVIISLVGRNNRLATIWTADLPYRSAVQRLDSYITLPAVRRIQEEGEYAIEFSIFGANGRLYGMIGFQIVPTNAPHASIFIHNPREIEYYTSDMTKQLSKMFPRGPFLGPFFRGLNQTTISAFTEGIISNQHEFLSLPACQCHIVCSAWNEDSAVAPSHQFVSSRLLLALLSQFPVAADTALQTIKEVLQLK